MKVAYPAGAWPRARCCPLGAASPALRPKLPSPVLKCHRRSAVAAPWKHSLACFGSPAAPRTAPRGPLVGVAVRSGADLGPLSDHSIGDSSRPGPHSHGGGRGRGRGREWVRHGYSHQETARQWSDGRGRGWVSDGGWKPGARSPAPAQGEPHARPAVDAPGGYRNRGRAADIKGGVRPNGGSGGYVRLSELRHLGELQEAVGRLAGRWAAKGDFGTLVAAFSYTCKLPADPSSRQPAAATRRALLHTLAGVYLPLLPSMARPDNCVMPLWACAKTGYGWAGGADELALAEALLGRLGEDGCALLRQALPQAHSNLWWSLSEGPNARLVAAQGQLLAASAECLVGMGARDIGPQACANVLLACARLKLSPTHVPLVHHLTRCLAELPNPDDQHLANSLYALGELHEDCGHVPHREDLRQLVGAVVRRLRGGRTGKDSSGGFSVQGISNMLLGCAKLGVEDGEAVQLLAAAAGAAAPRMTGQGLANSVWALGKLLEDATTPASSPCGDDDGAWAASDPSGRVNTVHTVRGCGMGAAVAVMALAGEVVQRLHPQQGEQQEQQHHYQQQQRRVWRPPGQAGQDHGAQFSPQELSNLLYGMALMQPYMEAMQPILGSMPTTSNRSNTATATTDRPLAAAVEALAGAFVQRSFRGFKPQELSNATWALAKMGHADQGWFAAAVAAAQLQEFTTTAVPTDWGQLWYALALVRHRPPPGLMKCTADVLEGQVRGVAPQGCASLLWSFAVLGVWEEQLAGVLLGRLAEMVERQQQGQQGQGTVPGGAGRAGGQVPTVVVQDLANALWAVAVAGPGALAAHSREVGVLLREAARRWEQARGFSNQDLQQLWQVQLELEAMEGGARAAGRCGEHTGRTSRGTRPTAGALSSILLSAGGGVAAGGAGSLRAAMERAAEQERLGEGPIVSPLQQQVLAALRRLQQQQGQGQQQVREQEALPPGPPASEALPDAPATSSAAALPGAVGNAVHGAPVCIRSVQSEAAVPALRSRVDVLVQLSDGRVVAVEVDGPTHFLGNSPHTHTRLGQTVLRDRQLARVFGHGNVVCVPYWEWGTVQRDKAAEEQYVWGLLAGDAGTAAAGLPDAEPGVEAAAAVGERARRAGIRHQEQEAPSAQVMGRAQGSQLPQARRQRVAEARYEGHGSGVVSGGAAARLEPQGTGGEGRRRRRTTDGGESSGDGDQVKAPPAVAPIVLVPRRPRRKASAPGATGPSATPVPDGES